MKFELKKELPIIGIVLVPFVYLATIWKSLPEKVPTHWNFEMQADAWGDKSSLFLILFMLPVLTYVLMTVIPKIDPKKKLELMGGKYYQLKFVFVLLMSVLSIFILYTTKNQSISNINFIYILIGLLFVFLGNYFKTIQPNYFIGIKTPWTLNNEEVWKSTHVLAGKLWVFGGLIIVISSFILNADVARYMFFAIVGLITIIPIVFSYKKSKELEII